MAVDSGGNVYIADTNNDVIEKVTPGGTLSIIAGMSGLAGPPTVGLAIDSHLSAPAGVAVDGSGNVYIADTGNNEVEEISGGNLSIVAGTGTGGVPIPGPATSSPLAGPLGVAVNSGGTNLYIADTGNNVVEQVTGGTLSIIAGTGTSGAPVVGPATSSPLNAPAAVAVDAGSNVYIADRANQRIEEVSGGNCRSSPGPVSRVSRQQGLRRAAICTTRPGWR